MSEKQSAIGNQLSALSNVEDPPATDSRQPTANSH